MKSKWLIEGRMKVEEDPIALEVLRWVIESPECPLCNHPQRKDFEFLVANGTQSPPYLESKHGWPDGIVEEHMKEHITYDAKEAEEVEEARSEAISTLDMAEDVFSRIQQWLDEWEELKEQDGISREWLSEATKLVAAGNQSLKLIGTLKKEIGVDSQLMLAHQQVQGILGVVVDVLQEHPQLMNTMELRLAALKAPTTTIEAEFEVIE